MMDFIYSKLAILVAVCILISFFIMFFNWQETNVNIMELENVLDEISGQISMVSLQDAGTSQNITFEKYGEGVRLPSTIDGRGYQLTIYDNAVYAEWEGGQFVSQFSPSVGSSEIHFWRPDLDTYLRSEIEELDVSENIMIPSGQDFIIERKLIEVNAHLEYQTFIYINEGGEV